MLRVRVPRIASLASGALSGTSSIVSGATGILTAVGLLIGTSAVTSNATGLLTGAGALSGTCSIVSGATGTLGTLGTAGSLSGTVTIVSGATGSLEGAGALSGTAVIISGATGNLVDANAAPPAIVPLGYSAVPEIGGNDVEHRRKLARGINSALQGKINAVTTLTLSAGAAKTTLQDVRITTNSFIDFMPTTANAVTAKSTIYVTDRGSTPGTATINHASNAQTDRTFTVLIIG